MKKLFMKKLWWSLLLLVCLELSLAQPMITNVQPLPDLLGVDDPRFPLLSPDGSMIFYKQDNDLCFFEIANTTSQCYAYPETFGGMGRYSAPVWSPDSTRVVFTESFFDMFRESDLWQLEVATGDYTNLTDDGIRRFDIGNEDPAMTIDYLPTFSPTGELYFFRSRPTSGINEVLGPRFSLELFKLSATLEAVRVSSLRPQLPIFAVSQPAAISPDGKHIAFIVAPPTRDDPSAGVWVQDLATGQREHVLPLTSLPELYPAWAEGSAPLLPMHLTWEGNQGLVVHLINPIRSDFFHANSLLLELDTNRVTPLEDFLDVTQEMMDTQDSPRNHIPQGGFVTSDGAHYLYAHWDAQTDKVFFWSQPIPFNENATLLTTVSNLEVMPIEILYVPATVSTDGKRALVFGCLLTLE
jgi:WD40-like Beta Propeller Repeat